MEQERVCGLLLWREGKNGGTSKQELMVWEDKQSQTLPIRILLVIDFAWTKVVVEAGFPYKELAVLATVPENTVCSNISC